MKLTRKLNRRVYCLLFSAFILVFLVKYNFRNEPLDIDNELYKKIKKYNLGRTIKSEEDYKLSIQKDHEQNKTIWIGKKLYTYAELSKLKINWKEKDNVLDRIQNRELKDIRNLLIDKDNQNIINLTSTN